MFFFCVVFCLFSYINIDPLKCSFFLVISLLFFSSYVSFFCCKWFSYFICLLFLRGVFVIIVYFSRVSGVRYRGIPGGFFCFFLSFLLFFYFFLFSRFNLFNIYCKLYSFLLFLIFSVLVLFINFISYYLSFCGGMRSI